MQSTIIRIGNSKGVRLPKDVLTLSGIEKDINIQVKKGEIKITPSKKSKGVSELALASEAVLARDWLRPEEEEAWKVYQ